ncbi:MAG: response regulator transcription factor [Magnetococcales bacterium]|nr:response regulator transcription factor [Magnetococcales bacterium]
MQRVAMSGLRILIIEDNQDLADNLFDFLEARHHILDHAADGITGLHLAVVNDYDGILLDLILPGLDGVTLCRKLRQEAGKSTPILMLTARDSLEDKIIGLEAGADDYLVKPFAMREMETRLRVLVRRSRGEVANTVLRLGDLSFDPGQRLLRRGGRHVELPPIPMRLVELLLRAASRVVTRQELEGAIWGDTPPDSDALRAHMHVLRAAVDRPGERPLLHTVRGVGYRLAESDE